MNMFTNLTILLCFAALLIPYYLLPTPGLRRGCILAMNFGFYYLLCGAAVVWPAALCPLVWAMGRALTRRKSAALCAVFVCIPVAALCAVRLLPGNAPSVFLPVGLSFFGMQSISYLADIYRGHPDGSFFDCALFISFFPTVTSGPILKWRESRELFTLDSPFKPKNLTVGIQRFTVGLLKKLVIADRLSVAVNAVYRQPGVYSGGSLLLATVGYGLQLYMDFSGYSDMAIGVARMLGIAIPENFNMPYLSENLSEFWKRWHISLSSWLTEYVYIPLGGSRKGHLRTKLNSVATMVVSGLWHGFSWSFVLWGFLHGVVLNLQKAKPARLGKCPRPISVCLNTAVVTLLWIPFRAASLRDAWVVFSRIVRFAPGVRYYYGYTVVYGLLTAAVSVYAFVKRGKEKPAFVFDLGTFRGKFCFLCEILLISALASFGNSAFIYAGF